MLIRQRRKIETSTPEQFVKWLLSKTQDVAIADVYEGASCPVRRFIEETVKVEVFVGVDEIAEHFVDHGHPTKTVRTPYWIQKFILALHNWADERSHAKCRSERSLSMTVTPAEVREVLIGAELIPR